MTATSMDKVMGRLRGEKCALSMRIYVYTRPWEYTSGVFRIRDVVNDVDVAFVSK